MKPHLFKRHKLWYCRTMTGFCGLGYTPADAYAEWMDRNSMCMNLAQLVCI